MKYYILQHWGGLRKYLVENKIPYLYDVKGQLMVQLENDNALFELGIKYGKWLNQIDKKI